MASRGLREALESGTIPGYPGTMCSEPGLLDAAGGPSAAAASPSPLLSHCFPFSGIDSTRDLLPHISVI